TRTCLPSRDPRGPRRPNVHLSQATLDARGRGGASRAPAPPESVRGTRVQAVRRSACHERGTLAAKAEPGRAAAALPRAPGSHEPRGAASSLSRGGRALRALDAAAPLRHAGADLSLADPRPEQSRVRRVDSPGSRVCGPAVLSPGCEDP